MPTYSSPTQWDSDEDIAAAIDRIAADDAKGLVLHDDAMGTNYSDLSTKDGINVSFRDEIDGNARSMTVHEITTMLRSGDGFVVGGAGEARFDAAHGAPKPQYASNPYRSKAAVLGTVKQISAARGEPIDQDVLAVLSDLSEVELATMAMDYAEDPTYRFEEHLDIPRPTLN